MENINIDIIYNTKGKRTSSGQLNVDTILNHKRKGIEHSFNIEKLINVHEKKRKMALKEYEIQYQLCLKNIEEIGELGKKDLIYTVPCLTIYHCPNYTTTECIAYIEKRLRDMCFETLTLINDESLFITWFNLAENIKKKEEEEEHKKEEEEQQTDK